MATFDERFRLPVELPDSRVLEDFQVNKGYDWANRLFGTGEQERYQTWPERMVRSGFTLPADVYSGREPIYDDNGRISQKVIERAQDTAGMAAGGSLLTAPAEATLTAGLKPPKKLYRGIVEGMQESGAEGSGLAHLGKGIYSSADKDFAKMYANKGRIVELSPEEAWPKNPLELNGAGGAGTLFMDWVFKNSDFKNAREFNKAYPDPATFIREKGYDGVITNKGEEVVKFPTLLEDAKAGTAIGALNQSGMYSNLERTIANSKVQKGTPEEWQAYLKNQPGIKGEELEFALSGFKGGTKADLERHIAENGVKLGEVWKGTPSREGEFGQHLEKEAKHLYGKAYDDLTPNQQTNVYNNVNYIYNKEKPKYSSYQLPGGENYRELLLTVPEKNQRTPLKDYISLYPQIAGRIKTAEDIANAAKVNANFAENIKGMTNEQILSEIDDVFSGKYKPNENNYKSSHWDEPNVLAHIRMNDREVPGVGKTLHLEELQSDWHQAGRKEGYQGSLSDAQLVQERINLAQEITKLEREKRHPDDLELNKLYLRLENINAELANGYSSGKVPNAPFKKTWDELALKRSITEAVKNGYDAISWTPGEAQVARYDLSKQVDKIEWKPSGALKDSTLVKINPINTEPFRLQIDKTGKIIGSHPASQGSQFEGKLLSDVIGKEHSDKILAKETGDLSGDGLKIGGKGMKSFYDKMLVDKANSLVKKLGGKVEYQDLAQTKVMRAGPEDWRVINLEDNRGYPRTFKTEELAKEYAKQKNQSVPIIRITPAMREKIAKEGFPLFSAPVLVPVDHNPFEPKLKPVDFNPFENAP